MVLIHVAVTVKSAQQEIFEIALASIVQEAKDQDGCTHYAWYRMPKNVYAYVIYGEFKDRHAFNTYGQSNVVKRIGTELLPLLEGKPSFKHIDGAVFESA